MQATSEEAACRPVIPAAARSGAAPSRVWRRWSPRRSRPGRRTAAAPATTAGATRAFRGSSTWARRRARLPQPRAGSRSSAATTSSRRRIPTAATWSCSRARATPTSPPGRPTAAGSPGNARVHTTALISARPDGVGHGPRRHDLPQRSGDYPNGTPRDVADDFDLHPITEGHHGQMAAMPVPRSPSSSELPGGWSGERRRHAGSVLGDVDAPADRRPEGQAKPLHGPGIGVVYRQLVSVSGP